MQNIKQWFFILQCSSNWKWTKNCIVHIKDKFRAAYQSPPEFQQSALRSQCPILDRVTKADSAMWKTQPLYSTYPSRQNLKALFVRILGSCKHEGMMATTLSSSNLTHHQDGGQTPGKWQPKKAQEFIEVRATRFNFLVQWLSRENSERIYWLNYGKRTDTTQ